MTIKDCSVENVEMTVVQCTSTDACTMNSLVFSMWKLRSISALSMFCLFPQHWLYMSWHTSVFSALSMFLRTYNCFFNTVQCPCLSCHIGVYSALSLFLLTYIIAVFSALSMLELTNHLFSQRCPFLCWQTSVFSALSMLELTYICVLSAVHVFADIQLISQHCPCMSWHTAVFSVLSFFCWHTAVCSALSMHERTYVSFLSAVHAWVDIEWFSQCCPCFCWHTAVSSALSMLELTYISFKQSIWRVRGSLSVPWSASPSLASATVPQLSS